MTRGGLFFRLPRTDTTYEDGPHTHGKLNGVANISPNQLESSSQPFNSPSVGAEKLTDYCNRHPERTGHIADRLELAASASAKVFSALREITAYATAGPERAAYILEQSQITAQASHMLAQLMDEINEELRRV